MEGLLPMFSGWQLQPEYSHGMLIPLVAAFLVWQRSDQLARAPFAGSRWGIAGVALGLAILALGKLAALQSFIQYSFVITLSGLVLALTGSKTFKLLLPALLILLFMIPLPAFLFNNLSLQLQLLSSQIGVWFIRLFGISVFLEGNVIDLGGYKLEVAQACSGLRYLFPLMTLGFIMAYFYKVAWWKRALLFASSILLTVVMNSFRIGTIGVMVEHWGTSMAEGFLHEFQGWAVFMTTVALLLLEMALLSRLGAGAKPWREVFGVEFPAKLPTDVRRVRRTIPKTFAGASALFAISAVGVSLIPARAEIVPSRELFVTFPETIDVWHGRKSSLDAVYVDALKFDDYVNADFVTTDAAAPINLYIAWYNSQHAGQSAHSPRSCLPGGGWRIESLTQRSNAAAAPGLQPHRINRAIISQGGQRQLVYYWFQQRGRVITNEYAVKWYLAWDSLTRRRTDGSLVRLIAPISPGRADADVDAELTRFVAAIAPRLPQYIPG
jgi:exosortase D (VPLPA-CTERM-specific)